MASNNSKTFENLKSARNDDTEWLCKYKRIVDGLQQIAEIASDTSNADIDEWATVASGLRTLSKLMKEDIDGRDEEFKGK